MELRRRMMLVRAIAYVSLVLAIVGFSFGIGNDHYTLVTVSFAGALVAFISAFAAGFVADLLFQWRTSLVRLGAIAVFAGAVFGFSLGISFENNIILVASFVAALLSIATGFNAPLITRALFERKDSLGKGSRRRRI